MSITGLTLPELLLCLLLLGVAIHVAVAPLRHQADLLAVRGAREELIALLQRARAEARSVGEATVVLEEGADPYLILAGDRPPAAVPMSRRGVRLEIAGSRSSVSFRYGPLGVPRFAAASVRLVKRDAEAMMVVSTYGRVRR